MSARPSPPSTAEAPAGRRLLGGWVAKTPQVACELRAVHDEAQIAALLADPPGRGVLARGAGHSWGDAAQRAGGLLLETRALNSILEFDRAAGTIRVEAGLNMGELLAAVVPEGWLPPVLPTTRFVTVGGAIAADIHGRNQHRDGSFADHLASFRLLTPAGPEQVDPSSSPELFRATLGGMGLTGVVLDATLRLIPIETAEVRVWVQRAADLDAVMAALEQGEGSSRYSVAWIDCLAPGGALGRGVIARGEHATREEAAAAGHSDGLEFSLQRHLRLPRRLPPLLRGGRVRAMNELAYRRAARAARPTLRSLSAFFHVHDHIDSWMPLSGRPGFVAYQFLAPPDRAELVRAAIERLVAAGAPPFFAVLKRFGPGQRGALSFPGPGWMADLSVPASPGVSAVLNELDERIAEGGGRVYLAKDARLGPQAFAAMYPGLGELREARKRYDPGAVLRSDLSARLGI
jgi:decaprenylphospho-beta-D-ribofuranose 2-oxidase